MLGGKSISFKARAFVLRVDLHSVFNILIFWSGVNSNFNARLTAIAMDSIMQIGDGAVILWRTYLIAISIFGYLGGVIHFFRGGLSKNNDPRYKLALTDK